MCGCAGTVYLWFVGGGSSPDRDDNNITSVILKLVIYGLSRTRRVHLGFKGFSLLLFSRSINHYPSVARLIVYCFIFFPTKFCCFLRWLLSDVSRRRRRRTEGERHTPHTLYDTDDAECLYIYSYHHKMHSEPIECS